MTHVQRDDDVEIYIAEPCSKAWDDLTSEDARRYCSKCALHVINGAALTRTEALAVVRGAAGRVCMRLEVDPTGAPRFRVETVPAHAAVVVRSSRWLASASAALLAACAQREPSESPVALPVAVEPTHMTERALCYEPTVLDSQPVKVSQRQPIAPVKAAVDPASSELQPPSPVVRRYVMGGAVAVRRVVTPPPNPK